jgi:uncharacterized protein
MRFRGRAQHPAPPHARSRPGDRSFPPEWQLPAPPVPRGRVPGAHPVPGRRCGRTAPCGRRTVGGASRDRDSARGAGMSAGSLPAAVPAPPAHTRPTAPTRPTVPSRVSRGPRRVAISLVKAYQGAASGRMSPCRFYPSCSSYAVEAFEVHGFWRATALTARRLLRCRPFGPHGVDLVPLPADGRRRERNP